MNLPGQEEAEKLGYSLHFHSGDHSSATYSKGELALTVNNKGTATLYAIIKMVILRIENFSFPHKNFLNFERQLNDIVNRCIDLL